MAEHRIQDIFNRRYFDIPKYQRGFAWEKAQIRELYEDIVESIETKTDHYLGTLVLSQKLDTEDHYYIVDGQQRIITITLFINEIIKHLSREDKTFYRRFYLSENGEIYKLNILGKDNTYLRNLLKGKINTPESKSQRLLKEAYEEIRTIIAGVSDKSNFLRHIERLEVMEFIEETEGDAIRIFQTVNDRGKPLSNMEKAKSLLIYFSNRYLHKKLDNRINEIFGEVFEKYDDIKNIGEKEGVDLISGQDFNEDSIMRHHFITFCDENYDATAAYVLTYLKKNLTVMRSEDGREEKIEHFISSYAESLLKYFTSLKDILKKVSRTKKYYQLFVSLGPSTYLYPLIVKLEMFGKLDQKLPNKEYGKYTFLDLIEFIDVRVYKTRGTDPRAEISRFASEIDEGMSDKQISNWLLNYNKDWMSRGYFESSLRSYIYDNRALVHIFTKYCENLREKQFTLKELKEFEGKSPTIEHILAQTPKFTYRSVGFKGKEEFEEYEHRLGNLTIVERVINSAVQNKLPIEKVPQFDKSNYMMTKNLATSIIVNKRFAKQDIKDRTEGLVPFILDKWWC